MINSKHLGPQSLWEYVVFMYEGIKWAVERRITKKLREQGKIE